MSKGLIGRMFVGLAVTLGLLLSACSVIFNKTIAGKSYIYPLIPFRWSEVKKRLPVGFRSW